MVLVDGSQAEGGDGQVNKALIGEDHCAVFIASSIRQNSSMIKSSVVMRVLLSLILWK
jgi:hypothetical protein